jgi:hypothetical protein
LSPESAASGYAIRAARGVALAAIIISAIIDPLSDAKFGLLVFPLDNLFFRE